MSFFFKSGNIIRFKRSTSGTNKNLSTSAESGVKKIKFQPIGSKVLKLHLLVLYHFYPVFGMVGFIQMPFLYLTVQTFVPRNTFILLPTAQAMSDVKSFVLGFLDVNGLHQIIVIVLQMFFLLNLAETRIALDVKILPLNE